MVESGIPLPKHGVTCDWFKGCSAWQWITGVMELVNFLSLSLSVYLGLKDGIFHAVSIHENRDARDP